MMQELKIGFSPITEEMTEWFSTTAHSDTDVLSYPTLRVLRSYNHKSVAYLPMQRVLMLESMAKNPEAEPLQYAQALRDLVKGAEVIASSDGIKEICLLGTDENVVKMAQARGFEELPWKLYRLKL